MRRAPRNTLMSPQRTLASITLALTLASAHAPAGAQNADALARVDALIESGRITDARAALADWQRSQADAPTPSVTARAHAEYLHARLAPDWAAAERAYLGVALTYPASPHAPLALLRLGQGLLAAHDARTDGAAARALGYLERLTTDYPRFDRRAEALLWLARAHRASGRAGVACQTLDEASRARPAEDVLESIRFDATSCSDAPRTDAPNADVRFAVQAGAFREKDRADDLARRARARGFDARVVTLEGGTIFRVRVGNFSSKNEAESTARRLRDAGFETVVLDDVAYERPAR